jgi:hypothetical protein
MARIYANENFPFPAVEELKKLGHDVLTTLESGQSGKTISDETVLAFAVHETRILITLNRKHFIRLHEIHPEHAGILVCSFDPDFSALAHRIDTILNSESIMTGQLIRVNRPNE